jgi:DNA polymerase I
MDYPISMANRILLIDATGLVFRAYYGIGPLTAPDGTHVNAVFGLLRYLMKLFRDLPASASAVVFDAGAKTFRNELYAQYKAHRPPPPDELRPQFGLAIELARACQAPVFMQQGFEADDIIATLATQAEALGYEVDILTSDRDILQLLSPQVHVLLPQKSGDFKEYSVEGFAEEYGFGVERYLDYKALMGDPSDNIPGVAGIGPKTAAKLVATYGRLEQLYANIDFVKPDGVRAKLSAAKQEVQLWRQLVTLRHDVPVSYDFSVRTLPNFGSAELLAMLEGWGFNRIREDAAKMGDLAV